MSSICQSGVKKATRTPDVCTVVNTLATIYPPALLLYNCLTNLLALHCEVISATALALTNAVHLPKTQLHITAVLLLTVFDVVLCQTNATKLRHLLCDLYSIYNGVRVTMHHSPSQLL